MECSNLITTALQQGDISTSLFKGSSHIALITDLQRVLFELGFKRELKFDNYQATEAYESATSSAVAAFATKNNLPSDGTSISNPLATLMLVKREYAEQLNFLKFGADESYGKSTRKAMIVYAHGKGIESKRMGDLLTRPLMDQMLKDLNAINGKDWSDLAANNLPTANSSLVLFEASRFQGAPCRTDVLFVPMLTKMNQYTEQADVFVHVTNSFQTSSNVAGAIVKPATRSNHMAGYAIDMNVVYDTKTEFANSQVLDFYPTYPIPSGGLSNL